MAVLQNYLYFITGKNKRLYLCVSECRVGTLHSCDGERQTLQPPQFPTQVIIGLNHH